MTRSVTILSLVALVFGAHAIAAESLEATFNSLQPKMEDPRPPIVNLMIQEFQRRRPELGAVKQQEIAAVPSQDVRVWDITAYFSISRLVCRLNVGTIGSLLDYSMAFGPVQCKDRVTGEVYSNDSLTLVVPARKL